MKLILGGEDYTKTFNRFVKKLNDIIDNDEEANVPLLALALSEVYLDFLRNNILLDDINNIYPDFYNKAQEIKMNIKAFMQEFLLKL